MRLAITRYSVGAMQSTLTRSEASSSSRCAGSNRSSWSSAVAPRIHGAMNTFRADFDQPRRGRAPDEIAGPRVEPVLGLEPLAGQVALAVDDARRLAGGAAGERDQARVVRLELGGRGRLGVEQRLVGDGQDRARRGARARSSASVALVGDDQLRLRGRDPLREVLGPELLVARERNRADPEARDHRQHPLGAVADHGHHDVAAFDAVGGERAREARAAVGDLGEAPLAPAAVAGELDQRRAVAARRRRRRLARNSSRRPVCQDRVR